MCPVGRYQPLPGNSGGVVYGGVYALSLFYRVHCSCICAIVCVYSRCRPQVLSCLRCGAMADVLEVEDAEAAAWFARQGGRPGSPLPSSGDPVPDDGEGPPAGDQPFGRVHLLLGCSIARDAGLEVGSEDDIVIDLTTGGNTWSRVASHLRDDLRSWRNAAVIFGLELGKIIIWLSGNEAYDRHTGSDVISEAPPGQLEGVIRDVLAAVRQVGTPVLLGALPRIWTDRLLPWEHTPAYKLDRKVKEAAAEGEYHSLGKALTKKLQGRHVLVDDCREWFRPDGIHLSRAGYAKVASASVFPSWLTISPK